MKLSVTTCIFFILAISFTTYAQKSSITVTTSVTDELKPAFKKSGRIFLFVSQSRREPRRNTWPGRSNMIFATNLKNWEGKKFVFDGSTKAVKTVDISLDSIPAGKYSIQVLWDQERMKSGINDPGNLFSEVKTIELSGNEKLNLPLSNKVEETNLPEHKFLKEVEIKSTVLSEWWGKEMKLKAAVFLPRSFFDEPRKKYPVRYNIAGYGGRYTRASRMLRHMNWWLSDDAPEIVNVFLDGDGPFGDCYQLNSANSGPYGTALTEELIPYIEKKFRAIGTPETRFVEGCSTGGWVSLALQLFYPNFFGGCFSYSPDPVDFHNFQLVDIYEDENMYYNEFNYLRPIVRNVTGEPIVSFKDFVQYENVLGKTGTYVTSGGQFGAFTALFSPKGDDGLPVPLFDPVTGEIDREVAEYWRKHDLLHYVDTNWKTLGPKITGKIWIWGADMDNFYLNPALREFENMLSEKENPKSDAVITFSPMAGHCQEYNDKKVLLQIKEKLESQPGLY